MSGRLATFVLFGILGVASCTDDPVVLATLPPPGAPPHVFGQKCVTTAECKDGTYCEKPACAAPAGSCKTFQASCTLDERPVCGCDGITYWNDCLRRAMGVSLAYDRECESEAQTCLQNGECPNDGVCARLVGTDPERCGRDTIGRCWVIPPACPPPATTDLWAACTKRKEEVGACVDLCNAIATGEPHRREKLCNK